MIHRKRGSLCVHSVPAVVALAVFFLTFDGVARAQTKEPDGIGGHVVDTSGAGVAAAKVWVIGGSWEKAESVAEVTTDGQGAFLFPGLWK